MTPKVELAELAELARLIYSGYRESTDAFRKDTEALQVIRDTPALAEHEAGARQNLILRGNVQGKYVQSLGDLANAVCKQLPELWPTLRLVGSGVRWHDDPAFDWAAGIAELRQIEAAVCRRLADMAEEPAEDPPKQSSKPDSLSQEEKALAALVAHPEWTDTAIAEHAGCGRTSLYRWPRYVAAREALETGRQDRPRADQR